MSVTAALFRLYRLIILAPVVIMLLIELVGVTAIVWAADLRFSLWVAIAGSMARYWSGIVGVMLISMNLRPFIAGGVTRREFTAGAAVFALIIAAGFGVVVTLGHWLEGLTAGALGERNPVYPLLSAGGLIGEFSRVAPQAAAWFVSGAVITVGFYRFRPWLGMLVLLLGVVPALATDALVGIDEGGRTRDLLPYLPGLLISLTLIALAATAFRLLTRDVPIRRAAG